MNNAELTLLSIPQAAERLNVTVSCVRRWALERKIATVKIGRLVRVPVAEIARLVAYGTRPARPR